MTPQDNSWYEDLDPNQGSEDFLRGPAFPFFQWVHKTPGVPESLVPAGTGGFFLPQAQFPDGWVATAPLTTIQPENAAEEIPGCGWKGLHIAVLKKRLDWFTYMNGRTTFWPDYNTGIAEAGAGNVRGRTRIVCVVKEFGEYGPFMLTMKGINGRNLDSLIGEFFTKVHVRAQSQIAKRQLPPYTFWIPVVSSGRRVLSGGQGTKMITPPELRMPAEYDLAEWCAANYIGKPMAKLCRESWDKVKEWAEAPIVSNAFGEPETKQASRQASQGQGQRGGGAPVQDEPFPTEDVPW
jgi:hypothetical protein